MIGSLDGFEYYHPLRDSQQIIALAGGVGVTPFLSMAKAIINGTIDCQLTQIYGANTFEEVMFSQEWEALKEASKGKLNYAIVLAKEERNNTEYGFITVDLIEKYQQIEGASLFISGPNGMLQYIKSILVPLNLQKNWCVMESVGIHSVYLQLSLQLWSTTSRYIRPVKRCLLMPKATRPFFQSLEKADLKPPVLLCNSGSCCFCRAYLTNGDISLASDEPGVRKKDQELGFIHPCFCFPASDLEMVVQRA